MKTPNFKVWISILAMFSLSSLIGALFIVGKSKYTVRNYYLYRSYDANSIYNGPDWQFSTTNPSDISQGSANYVSRNQAVSLGIFKVQNNQLYVGAQQVMNGNPSSIRLYTPERFTGGLWIFDSTHVPSGCGTWPAFWLVGANWPTNGEIDILEGINGYGGNTVTLHSNPGCFVQINNKLVDCNRQQQGCGEGMNNPNTFGDSFNKIQGGIYAMEWVPNNGGGVKVWFFPRNNIPADVTSNNPDPRTWPTNGSFTQFQFGQHCDSSYFSGHQMILNLNFCGGWAMQNFQMDCPWIASSCTDYIGKNQSAFNSAYFLINSIKYYKGV
ncbi:hypothetical protein HDV01_002945 [Terramyces sp. JEL0728]|nr:hypothetical protein HDV01_002945 [Terramyces sp. JEL0728]